MQAFALYRAYWPEQTVPLLPRRYWYQACAFFAVIGIDFLAGYYGGKPGAITDPAGHPWNKGDIYETAAIICLYTMIFVTAASAATILLGRGPKTSDAA